MAGEGIHGARAGSVLIVQMGGLWPSLEGKHLGSNQAWEWEDSV